MIMERIVPHDRKQLSDAVRCVVFAVMALIVDDIFTAAALGRVNRLEDGPIVSGAAGSRSIIHS
jgi:hypothetical protein